MNMAGLTRPSWRPLQTAVLGLEPEETDPVAIILAAQLRLRRHRRQSPARRPVRNGSDSTAEMRRIVFARDSLLQHVVERWSPTIDCRGFPTDHELTAESR